MLPLSSIDHHLLCMGTICQQRHSELSLITTLSLTISLELQKGELEASFLMLQTALVLRSIQRGYIPDKSFVIVSFLATGVLLIGWRSALAVTTQVGLLCALSINAQLPNAYLQQFGMPLLFLVHH